MKKSGEYKLPKNAAPDSLNQLPLFQNPIGTPAIRTEMVYSGRGHALRSGDWVYLPYAGPGGLFGTTFYWDEFGYVNTDYDAEGNLKEDHLPAQLYNLADDPCQQQPAEGCGRGSRGEDCNHIPLLPWDSSTGKRSITIWQTSLGVRPEL